MKKTKKITIKRPFKRKPAAEDRLKEAFANVPNITNETVAEHREDVLGSARKYIYPLKHSRRRAVTISGTIFAVAIVVFMTYTSVALYHFQSTSGFLYGVTKVIPFPVAKTGSSWVSYNSYLFELKHYMHYYATQQGVDFKTKSGQAQLASYKKQALQQVIDDALVKQLAQKNHVRVTDHQVNNQVALLRAQNRLGTSQHEFEEVLNEFWGWNVSDFKRSLQQQLLAQAVVAKLDTATTGQATAALKQLQGGADFATVAAAVSQDPSKANGGQYAAPLSRNDAAVPAAVMTELLRLQPGQTSNIINTGFTLEIVKLTAVQDGKFQASHMVFNFQPVETYLQPLRATHKPHRYIDV